MYNQTQAAENCCLNLIVKFVCFFHQSSTKPGCGLWYFTSQHTSTFACMIFPLLTLMNHPYNKIEMLQFSLLDILIKKKTGNYR